MAVRSALECGIRPSHTWDGMIVAVDAASEKE